MAESNDWTCTKAEWDALAKPSALAQFIFRMTLLLDLLLVVGLCAAWSFIKAPFVLHFLLWIALAMFLIGVGSWTWVRRATPRWIALHGVVWEARGCACPWCKTRVDTTPCKRHGFSAAAQPQLLAYWEALAMRDMSAIEFRTAELRRLAESLRPPANIALRLWRGVTAPYRRAKAHAVTASSDSNATALMRVRAAVPSWLFLGAGCAILGTLVYAIFGRSIFLGVLSGCWYVIPLTIVAAVIGPMSRAGRLRCTKCFQLCADATPSRCPECGSDLTKAGAVDRHSRPMGSRWAPMLIFALMISLPMLLAVTGGFGVMSQLPLSMQMWCHSWTSPPHGFFRSLTVATLSPAEAATAAQLLIAQAAPDGSRPVFDFDFLVKALASGKVPQSTREVAARATVLAELELATKDGVTTATVAPEFGALILGDDATPRFVFGGISVDGGAWSASSALSLMHHDLDSFWRALKPADSPLSILPESQLRYVTALALTPGTHEIRARGWIVLSGKAYKRFVPTFDLDGGLLRTPEMSGVYEIELHESVTIR